MCCRCAWPPCRPCLAEPISALVSNPDALTPEASATIQTRSRSWLPPTALAGMQCHCVSYPTWASAPRTAPIPLLSNSATFSSSSFGRPTMRTVRMTCQKSPERSPASPAPFPASDTSWQGKPAVTRSTGPQCSKLAVATSSYCGTSGQCFANTRRGNSSISQNATVSKPPVRSRPREKPPMPLKQIENA